MKKVLFIMLCVFLTGVVNAELLIYEDFENMTDGARPVNEPAENLGLGIATWWDNNACYADVTESVACGPYATGDQALNVGPSTGSNRRADFNRDASITIGPTLYFSFVFSGIAPAEPDGRNLAWSVESSGYLRAYALTAGGGIGTSLDGATVGEDNSDTLLGKGAFLIISKFEGIGTASGYSKIWAISPTAYGIILGGGITEAELDTYATLQATSATIDASAVNWDSAAQDYRFTLVTAGSEAVLDEIKMGTTLEDVVSNPPVLSAYAPTPYNGQINVELDTDLSWYNPTAYDASQFVLNFRANDPNWLDTVNTTVVDPVVDLDLDGDPTTTEAVVPVVLDNLKDYYWRVISTDPNNGGPIEYVGKDWTFRTVTAAAKILTQPVGQTVDDSTTVQLSIDGLNIENYQWFKDGVALDVSHPDIALYSGNQTSTLSFDATLATEGIYYCEASNFAGSDTSDAVVVMTKRLVGHWKLDNDLTDSVGDVVAGAPAHDGVTVDAPTFVAGVDNDAMSFTGDPNYVVEIVGSNDLFNFYPQGYTVSVWVNMSMKSAWGGIVSKEAYDQSSGFVVHHDNTGDSRHTLRGSFSQEGWDLDIDEWRLLAATFDGETGQGTLYVNGNIVDEDTGAIPESNSAALVFGGEVFDGSISTYEGLLDDIRIWSYPLDHVAIAHLYTDIETEETVCIDNPTFDISGPEGNPDCIVDLYDFAAIAGQWLDCNIVPSCL